MFSIQSWIKKFSHKDDNHFRILPLAIKTAKHYKIHAFIFAFLSVYFVFFQPIGFINRLVLATICIAVLLNIKNLNLVFSKYYEVILLLAINAYLTFAFCGFELFLTNIVDIPNGIILYSLFFMWTGYVLLSALKFAKYLKNCIKAAGPSSNNNYWRKWLILFAIMCSVFIAWQRAFNPVSMQVVDSWEYILGWRKGVYYDYRSPVYTFLVKIICSVAPSMPEVQYVAFAQIIAFSSLLATILMYFNQKYIHFKYLIPVSIIISLIPSLGLHTILILPDLACCMSITWLTYVLVRVLDEVIIHDTASRRQKISFCVQLCISLILCFFMRGNSFLVYLIVVPVLAFLFLRRKNWKLLATISVSVIMVLLIKLYGFKALNVIPGMPDLKYWGLMHDIQSTYYSGGKLSERTKNELKKYFLYLDEPEARAEFRAEGNGDTGYQKRDFTELTITKFIFMFADSYIHNPFKMIRSMLFRCSEYWPIEKKSVPDGINFCDIQNPSVQNADENYYGNAAQIGVYRRENSLTQIMRWYMGIMAMPIPYIFVWRYGFWVALMIISIMTLVLQRKFIWLLAYLPVFAYLSSLLLSMTGQAYRYGLPVFCVGLFLPLAFVLPERKAKDAE